MKIKQKDGVKAYNVLQKLNTQETSGRVALRIFKAVNAFQSVWDFQLQEAKKILDRHPDFDPKTSSISIEAKNGDKDLAIEEIKQVDKEIFDLDNLEVDVEFEPFTILLDEESLKLSGQDIKDLAGFITFE